MKNILIVNQYAANKGDRAVLFALVSELLKYTKNITVSTSDPELWKEYDYYEDNHICFVPWGWDYETESNSIKRFLQSIKKYTYTINRELFLRAEPIFRWIVPFISNRLFSQALDKADIVISTGGHHVTTILARDAISTQMFDLSQAIWKKKPLILWSQTIGPLDFHNERNRLFVSKILKRMNRAFIRDKESFALVKDIVPQEKLTPTYESVFVLNHQFKDYTLPSKRANRLGISIYSTKQRDEKETAEYVETIASLANHAISKGLEVEFFPMEIKGSGPDDRNMIKMIVKLIDDITKCVINDEDMDTLTHMKKVSECRIFIGHKTHSVIFALTVGTPIVALAYHVKTKDFLDQFGLVRNCIGDNDLTSELLIETFDNVIDELDNIGEVQYKKSGQFADKVSQDIASIFSERRG